MQSLNAKANSPKVKMTAVDYAGLNACLAILYSYGFMSGYELIACFITVPCAIVWWSVYDAVMDQAVATKKEGR